MTSVTTLTALSERLADIACKIHLPETLPNLPADASSDEVRRLLRWLRNLQDVEKSADEWFDRGTEAEQASKLESLLELITGYAMHLKQMKLKHPPVMQDAAVEEANQAVASLSLLALEHAIDSLPAGHPDRPRLEALLGGLPRKAELRLTQAAEHLLRLLEAGLTRVSGRQVSEQSYVDRLAELSHRIRTTATKLTPIDKLEPPVRAEAIELAREILRKLRADFGDRSFAESMDLRPPEERLSVTERVAEMVDMYKNLLCEAAQISPGIIGDPRVRAANDAVGGFSHAVALLAAKEIPASMAAAQKISADITQSPEEWKKLSGQTVDRLMNSMESGLEKAVSQLQVQQDVEDQQREQQQMAAEVAQAALAEEIMYGRRRGRRRRLSGGGLTKAAGRRRAGDLNGDGVLDQYQGLKVEDMLLAKQVGETLRGLGQQTADMPALEVRPPVEKKEPSEKASLLDRSVATDASFVAQTNARRNQQKKQKDPKNSRNNQQGPGA